MRRGLLAALRRNRRKLAVDSSARAFQERLQVEYAASPAKLLPLKARLAATDRLIDRVVYRLYGLTDDEIAIALASKSDAFHQRALELADRLKEIRARWSPREPFCWRSAMRFQKIRAG